MKVYLVKASEWESDVNCVCLTEDIAKRECKRLAKEYGVDESEWEEFINYTEMEVIE